MKTIRWLYSILAALPLMASATPPVTTAYSHIYTIGNGTGTAPNAATTDPSGNVYIASTCGLFGMSLWTFVAIDPNGKVLWTTSVSVENGSGVDQILAPGDGTLYAVGHVAGYPLRLGALRINNQGGVMWMDQYAFPKASGQYVRSMSVDQNGNLHVAEDVEIGNGASTSNRALLSFDGYGTVSYKLFPGVEEMQGSYGSDGSYLGVGRDPSGNYSWSLYNPSGTLIKSELATNTSVNHYKYLVDADGAGHYYVVTTLSQAVTSAYQVRSFNSAGAQLWNDGLALGQVQQVKSGQNADCYCQINDGSLEIARASGAGVTKSLSTAGTLFTDNTGYFLMDATIGLAGNMKHFLPSGVSDWNATANYPVTSDPLSPFAVIPTTSGTCFIAFDHLLQNANGLGVWKFCPGVALAGLTTATPKVQGGTTFTGTASLSDVASGNATINLSNTNPFVVSNPGTALVPSGLKSASFIANTAVVDSPTVVYISASEGGSPRSLAITVMPAPLSTIAFGAPTVKAGTSATGTVSLSGPTGINGRRIALSSSDVTVATVQAFAVIQPGQTSATFTVAAKAGQSGSVTISAVSQGATITKVITVTP